MIPEDRIILFERDLSGLTGGDNFLQSSFWGRFKSEFGWTALGFSYRYKGEERTVLALYRRFLKIFSIGYVPHAPDWSGEKGCEPALKELAVELQGYFPMGCLFVRFDLPSGSYGENNFPQPLRRRSLKKAPMDIQPPDTVIVDISRDEEEILSSMHKKTRYNIKLAEKKGVTIREAEPEEFDKWYELYRITSERDKIALHGADYYKRLLDLGKGSSMNFHLLFAEHEGDLLAGIIVGICGKRGTYLYGASSNEKRNMMPSYLLQWEAIQLCRKAGCESYDLFGIPPSDDPDHPMAGLYRFKTGFGGQILHRLGCWDYPYSRLFYLFYIASERIRKWYYKVFKKR